MKSANHFINRRVWLGIARIERNITLYHGEWMVKGTTQKFSVKWFFSIGWDSLSIFFETMTVDKSSERLEMEKTTVGSQDVCMSRNRKATEIKRAFVCGCSFCMGYGIWDDEGDM